MKKIRPSFLNDYNSCPRFSVEKDEDDFNPKVTYIWTILHQYARWVDSNIFLDYIGNKLNLRPVEKHNLKKLWNNARKFCKELISWSEWYWTEITMQYYLADDWYKDYYIEWTSDLVIIESHKELNLYDWKSCSSSSNYRDWKIREENMQHYVYSFLAMEYMWFTKCKFSYVPLVKNWRADVEIYTIEIDYATAKEKTLSSCRSYIFDQELDSYEEKRCSKCFFCPIAKKWLCNTFKKKG